MVSAGISITRNRDTNASFNSLVPAYPKIKEEALDAFGGLFLDLQEKADNSEISTKCMDLRGLLSALGAVKIGLTPWQAVQMGIINKAFDIFEREIVSDMAMTRIPEDWTRENVF